MGLKITWEEILYIGSTPVSGSKNQLKSMAFELIFMLEFFTC